MCKNTCYPRSGQGLHQQKGIATILLVVLIGIALIATSVGLSHSIRNTQEKQVAAHAVTHAQTGVWAGVEAFRRYTESLDVQALTALNGSAGFPITLKAAGVAQTAFGSLSVNDITVTAVGGIHRVTATVNNIHESAQSSAAVGIVLEVNQNFCSTCVQLSSSLDFYDHLSASGDVGFILETNGGVPPINVDGNVTMISIGDGSNFKTLNATGIVELGSGLILKSVHSNAGVELSGTVWVEDVTSAGYVKTLTGGSAGYVYANDYVDLGGASNRAAKPTHEAHSLSTIAVSASSYKLLRAADTITFKNTITLSAEKAVSATDVKISGSTGVNHIIAGKRLLCSTGSSWSSFLSVSTNGALDDSCNHLVVTPAVPATAISPGVPAVLDPRVKVNQNNTIELMNRVANFEMPGLVINVWPLREQANYIAEVDVDGRPTITVKNINGATNDATYFLGSYAGSAKSYLCTAVENGVCTAPTRPNMAACFGNSLDSVCLTYTQTNNLWKFIGGTPAPGIWWLDGNVELGAKATYATVLATGNVSTAGEYRGKSVNFAGYAEVCVPQGTNVERKVKEAFKTRYALQFPTNLCNVDTGTYTPQPAGNIAIAAGGKDPNDGFRFSGGNITIAASTELWGTVLAGDVLTTGGLNVIHGYVTASAQVTKGSGNNVLGGNTKIDLTSFPDHYSANVVPNMNAPCAVGCPVPTSGVHAKLLWSKYK